MLNRSIQTTVVLLMTVLLAAAAVTVYVAVPAEEPTEDMQTEETAGNDGIIAAGLEGKQEVLATVLGDSIAKGYSGDEGVTIEPYSSLVMKRMSEEYGFRYEISNYARNGLDSRGMNTKVLTDEQVRASLGRADIIFITIGSNDLLNECKSAVQDILNTETRYKSAGEALEVLKESAKENPFLIFSIIGALEQWNYRTFESNWLEMMDTVCLLKKDDARIVVTNIYNPVANLNIPPTMDNGVENVIGNMNQIIDNHTQEYGYQVADLFRSEVCDHVQSDGLHPDQDGQQLIADLICGEKLHF